MVQFSVCQLHKGGALYTKFIIKSEPVLASQLSSLKDLQGSYSTFKIYTDQPELKNETNDGSVQSQRVKKFPFIPEHAGTHLLPKKTITVPERKFRFCPAQMLAASQSLKRKLGLLLHSLYFKARTYCFTLPCKSYLLLILA